VNGIVEEFIVYLVFFVERQSKEEPDMRKSKSSGSKQAPCTYREREVLNGSK
jgi:hypothetical protein